MVTDKQLDDEFAFTSWQESCKHIHGDRRCRRPIMHDNEHASGFGKGKKRWT